MKVWIDLLLGKDLCTLIKIILGNINFRWTPWLRTVRQASTTIFFTAPPTTANCFSLGRPSTTALTTSMGTYSIKRDRNKRKEDGFNPIKNSWSRSSILTGSRAPIGHSAKSKYPGRKAWKIDIYRDRKAWPYLKIMSSYTIRSWLSKLISVRRRSNSSMLRLPSTLRSFGTLTEKSVKWTNNSIGHIVTSSWKAILLPRSEMLRIVLKNCSRCWVCVVVKIVGWGR